MVLSDKSVRILIAEGIPSLNKGELAILVGMLKTFEALGKVKVSVFSFDPSIDDERYPKKVRTVDLRADLFLGASSTQTSGSVGAMPTVFAAFQHFFFAFLYTIIGINALKVMKRPIWRRYCESDIIIICHDGVDYVGGWILNFSPMYITLLAKALGKTIVIYGNGGITVKRKIWKNLAKYLLSYVTLITVRDEESYSSFKNLGINTANLHLTGDPAILLPAADSERIREIMLSENITSGNLLVGAIVSHGTLLHSSKGSDKKYEKLVNEIVELLDRLIEYFKATVVFIPHCIDPSQNKDDRIVAKKIYSKIKNKTNVRMIINEYTSEELKGLMGQLSLLISSRVHASIGALSMNVPAITLTYSQDRRAYGLIGKMLKQKKWIYNIENLETDTLFGLVEELLLESLKVRKDLLSIVDLAKQKALINGKLLKNLLNS